MMHKPTEIEKDIEKDLAISKSIDRENQQLKRQIEMLSQKIQELERSNQSHLVNPYRESSEV